MLKLIESMIGLFTKRPDSFDFDLALIDIKKCLQSDPFLYTEYDKETVYADKIIYVVKEPNISDYKDIVKVSLYYKLPHYDKDLEIIIESNNLCNVTIENIYLTITTILLRHGINYIGKIDR